MLNRAEREEPHREEQPCGAPVHCPPATSPRRRARRALAAAFVVPALVGLAGSRPGRGLDPSGAPTASTDADTPTPAPAGTAPASGGSASPSPPGTRHGGTESDGRWRTWVVHIPPRHGPSSPALVIALHGRLGTGAGEERLTGLDDVADGHGFVVVYPDGVGRSWADGRGVDPADRQGVDDVAFLSRLISAFVHEGADPGRVYLTGMSDGAFMTQRFACERSDLVAAIMPVAGTLGTGLPCRPARPVPVLKIHGTEDPLVPYLGGPVRGEGAQVESAPAATARRRELDGCGPGVTTSAPVRGPDGTSVTVARGTGCPSGVDVELWTVEGGGHTWPGGLPYLPAALIGRTSDAFSASEVGWRFFAGHPGR